jgi:hypothetical protein
VNDRDQYDINPYEYAEPLDVHRWSDHPEVDVLLDRLTTDHLPDYKARHGRVRDYDKNSARRSLKILLLDLYVRWRKDPLLWTGIPQTPGSYKKSRYQLLHVTPKIIDVCADALAAGLLEYWTFKNPGTGGVGYVSRYRPTELLQGYFQLAQLTPDDLRVNPMSEIIILRDADKKDIGYTDTRRTRSMRTELRAWNNMIRRHHVDHCLLEEPVLKDEDGTIQSLIGQHRKELRRIFNNGSWQQGGRFYGGFWENMPRAERVYLCIDGHRTVELDYSSLHISLLYNRVGQRLTKDAYAYDAGVVGPLRSHAKTLMLAMINASTRRKAIYAAMEDIAGEADEEIRKEYSYPGLAEVADRLADYHPDIAEFLNSGIGVELQFIESQIMAQVMKHFASRDRVVLPVHDSIIVDIRDEMEADGVMAEAYRSITGYDCYDIDNDRSYFSEDMRTVLVDFEASGHPTVQFGEQRITNADGYQMRLSDFRDRK